MEGRSSNGRTQINPRFRVYRRDLDFTVAPGRSRNLPRTTEHSVKLRHRPRWQISSIDGVPSALVLQAVRRERGMWTRAPDGSVIDQNSRVIFFSEQRFVDDICLGECCFICGAAPGDMPFNNEHVLPEWLSRRYNLFDRTIVLPNGNTLRYDRYTVPCCVPCNKLMGERIEELISEITRRGAEATIAFLKANGNLEFFVWMGLIYLKTQSSSAAPGCASRRRQDSRRLQLGAASSTTLNRPVLLYEHRD
jgi:hypothetical protein